MRFDRRNRQLRRSAHGRLRQLYRRQSVYDGNLQRRELHPRWQPSGRHRMRLLGQSVLQGGGMHDADRVLLAQRDRLLVLQIGRHSIVLLAVRLRVQFRHQHGVHRELRHELDVLHVSRGHCVQYCVLLGAPFCQHSAKSVAEPNVPFLAGKTVAQ
jgi:hypothetical protein